LTLKHQAIVSFCEQYGVNFVWLLEGRGRIFEDDPIARMKCTELAALVQTLPEAQQRKIEAMVDQILRQRGL
jgi:hypothetical protein